MRAGCFFVVLAVALLIGGGQGLYTGLIHRECVVLSYDEFNSQKPRHGWFEVTGCSLNLAESMYRKRLIGGVKEVFIPVRGASDADADADKEPPPTRLVLLTKDPQILETVNGLQKAGKDSGGTGALLYAATHQDRVVLRRSIKGLLQYGIDVKSRVNEKLARLDEGLASDFVVLEEGKSPDLLFSLAAFGAGLLLSGYLVYTLVRGPSRGEPEPVVFRPASADAPGGGPPRTPSA